MPFIRRELDISPVIFVPGNHRVLPRDPSRTWTAFWRSHADAHTGFHYLNDETVEIGGLHFYGAEMVLGLLGRPDALLLSNGTLPTSG